MIVDHKINSKFIHRFLATVFEFSHYSESYFQYSFKSFYFIRIQRFHCYLLGFSCVFFFIFSSLLGYTFTDEVHIHIIYLTFLKIEISCISSPNVVQLEYDNKMKIYRSNGDEIFLPDSQHYCGPRLTPDCYSMCNNVNDLGLPRQLFWNAFHNFFKCKCVRRDPHQD